MVCTLSFTLSAGAQGKLELSLEQAIDIALENNLGLRSARIDTQIRTSGVVAEEARFGRSLNGGLSHQSDRSPSISALEEVPTSTSSGQALTFGLSQQLSTGGRVGLEFINNRSSSNAAFRTIDPVYNSRLELNFSQPLLQGRGSVNKIGIDLAHNGLEGARVDLDEQVRDLRAEVGLAYWDQFFSRANLEVDKQLNAGAQRVLETVRARAEMGTGTRSSILEAEVGVARRQEDIVISEGALSEAEDRLKAGCGLDQDPDRWAMELVLIDTPEVVSFDADLDRGIEKALAISPAYQQAQLLLKNLDLQIALARDRARPAVELNARIGLTGIGAGYDDNLEVLGKADGRSWQGGVNLNFPLGQTSEKAVLQQRQFEKQRRQVDLEDLRLQIAQQVRDQHRQARISQRRTEVASAAVRLAAQNVGEQEARLALGMLTVREVLDAQDDLASARASHLRAIVDYSKALIIWNRLIGE